MYNTQTTSSQEVWPMRKARGHYDDWRHIDYRPAVEAILPHRLIPHLPPGASVLDMGCNRGQAALFLARRGFRVVGIDINRQAIAHARAAARELAVADRMNFFVDDFLGDGRQLRGFDAVMLIRVLTCVPDEADWLRTVERSLQAVRRGGLVYIHDFVQVPDSPVYRARYAAGRAAGWRAGNFAVKDAADRLQFVAHHHDEAELAHLSDACQAVSLRFEDSLSMNGNPVRMFEFIGRAV